MLYLVNDTESQVVMIPRSGEVATGSLHIDLRSNINLVTTIDAVQDLNTSALYFNLAVTLPAGLPDGEYAYELKDTVGVLSSGLLIIQPAPASGPSQYEHVITYTQYESN